MKHRAIRIGQVVPALVLVGMAAGLLAAPGSSAVQSAPSVVTGAATSVTGTGATLNGTVNPNGEATTWRFEYGPTTGYGTSAPAVAPSAGSGASTVSVNTSVTGLDPGTTYHFRLTATNGSGSTVGADGTFSTPAATTVTTGAATAITTTSAKIACTVDPNGIATSWYVEYGPTDTYGTQTSSVSAGSGTAAVAVSTTLTGLTAAKTYHYRCVATNGGGVTVTRGANATFTTVEPPIVTTGTPSALGSTTATLTGKVDPRGRATTAYFEYGKTTAYGTKTANSSLGSGTAVVDVTRSVTGLTAGTTYHFRLVATSDGGVSHGADVTFTTLGAAIVTSGTASSIGATSAVVGGTVNPSGRATSWWVEYGPTTAYGSRSSSRSAGSSSTVQTVSASISGLKIGTLYHFRIVASNSLGTVRGADATFSTASPPTVTTGQVPIASLGPGSAKVTGIVNPRGLSTTAWFEYGRTPAYGQRSPQVPIPAGTADVPFEAELRGLVPGSRTYFRLVAVSAAGSGAGVGKSFGTPSASVNGRRCTIAGTQARDVLVGTPGRDVICGLGGHDVIRGLEGDDVLSGGPGNDILEGGSGADLLEGGTGKDVLKGGAGNDRLEARAGDDTLLGGAGADAIAGGPGNDSIAARDRRRDQVDGGPGADSAAIDAELDAVVGVERRR
jgi:trimeric autotransporter adhesin